MAKKEFEPIKNYEKDLEWIILNDQLFNSLLEDERRREVIRKHFIGKSSFEEIGSEMDLTPERIRQLYKDGLYKLKSKVLDLLQATARNQAIEEENKRLKKELVVLNWVKEANAKNKSQKTTDLDISDLGLSVRSLNPLKAADILTVGDLLQWTPSELLKLRNMGTKSIDEIQLALAKYGG